MAALEITDRSSPDSTRGTTADQAASRDGLGRFESPGFAAPETPVQPELGIAKPRRWALIGRNLMAKAKTTAKDSGANLGFEAKLWLAADKLRNNMDAAEYKHVVLGLK